MVHTRSSSLMARTLVAGAALCSILTLSGCAATDAEVVDHIEATEAGDPEDFSHFERGAFAEVGSNEE